MSEQCRSCEGPLQPDETQVCDVCLPHLTLEEIDELIDDPDRWDQALAAGAEPFTGGQILKIVLCIIFFPFFIVYVIQGGHGMMGHFLGDGGD